MKWHATCFLIATAWILNVDIALAQYGEGAGTVSGNGVVAIIRPPEIMRLQVVVQAKGATMKEALTALKTRTEAARKTISGLGSEKDSIKVGAARITPPANDQQRQMQMMMAQRMKGGKKSSKKTKTAVPVSVSAKITAEWKLKSKEADDLLVSATALQEKIKAADLGGTEAAASEEEEEADEEAAMANFGNSEEPKPGEPLFLFISHITDADREKALAEAYQKAAKEAARVAQAAEVELGSLRSLHATSTSASGAEDYSGFGRANMYAYRAIQAMRMQQQSGDADVENTEMEAVGAEPAPVKYNVTVIASFDIKPKQ